MNQPRYKRRVIEWLDFAVGDSTCDRCKKTGASLLNAVDTLRHELAVHGVKINLTETILDKTRIAESNEVRMNGTRIEDLLTATVTPNDCPSCGQLAGECTCCRVIEVDETLYEDISEALILKAAYRALGMDS